MFNNNYLQASKFDQVIYYGRALCFIQYVNTNDNA